ncbi:MAG TPA: helix-turn-helix domain-containing protein [Prolixibacteraceae bacterium]|jgi:hypothetical protein
MEHKPKTLPELDNELQEVKVEFRTEIQSIKKSLKKNRPEQLKELWMDGQEVSLALHISLRTLQHLRYSGQLPFSQFHNKIFYKTSDVNVLLESNYSLTPKNQAP